jgi:alkylated DNA nucleotide flippase Atl1
MASARAAEVAEVLWELKRAGKVATYTVIARRSGFSPGSGGRTMITTMKTVRRDWPHLQWFRALPDDGLIVKDSEHAHVLAENEYEIVDADSADEDEKVTIADFEGCQMVWESDEEEAEE